MSELIVISTLSDGYYCTLKGFNPELVPSHYKGSCRKCEAYKGNDEIEAPIEFLKIVMKPLEVREIGEYTYDHRYNGEYDSDDDDIYQTDPNLDY